MRSVAQVVWSALLLTVGALELSNGWTGWQSSLVLVACAVVPMLVVVTAVRLGVSTWAAAAVVLILCVLTAYLAGAPAGGTLRSTLTDALPRLLTAPIPAPASAELLAPGGLLAALAGVFVAVRSSSKARVAPVAAAAVLYLSGALLTAGKADPRGLVAAALVVLAVGGWVVLDSHAEAFRRRVVAIAPVLAVLVGACGLAAVPARDEAFEPRDLVTPPVDEIVAASPLPQLAAWGRDPEAELFRVRGDMYPLHLVALPDYDGASWRAETRFRPLGASEHASLPGGARQARIRAQVDLVALDGPWVPAPGTPENVSDGRMRLDPETGSLALPGREPDGPTYRVDGYVDVPVAADLEVASVPSGPSVARYLTVPRLPFRLADYARAVTRRASTPAAQALAIESAVRGRRNVNPKAPSGSNYARLDTFLLGKKGVFGAQTGTSEQFASAFAVLARATGLPTRVVVGFRPGTPVPDSSGIRSVRGADAMAWPEVYFSGLGWVPFSPTPQAGRMGPDINDRTPVKDDKAEPVPTPSPGATESAAPSGPAAAAGPPAADSAWRALLLPGLAALVVLFPLAAVLLARAARRRRHRAAGPRGAWSELLDIHRLINHPVPPSRPAPDLAAALDTHLTPPAPGPVSSSTGASTAAASAAAPAAPAAGPTASASAGPAVRVAEAAERAAFAPEPSSVTDVWPLVVEVRRKARHSLSWWRQVLWPLDPRPLLRRPTS